jgi:hypothetical protein
VGQRDDIVTLCPCFQKLIMHIVAKSSRNHLGSHTVMHVTCDEGKLMAVGATNRRGSNFNLGGEQAEADPLLRDAFYESDDYLTVASQDDSRCFLIARTGSGKSAALQRLEEDNPEHVVRVAPEDLSLHYITNLGVMRYLEGLNVNLDPFFIALWKHVLLVELIRHRYKVDSAEAKKNFISTLRD